MVVRDYHVTFPHFDLPAQAYKYRFITSGPEIFNLMKPEIPFLRPFLISEKNGRPVRKEADKDDEKKKPKDEKKSFSSKILSDSVKDIDLKDSKNPQLLAEYVKDIYKYLQEIEVRTRLITNVMLIIK